jgi:nucleotide-binding universal stress UspA family protein
MFNYLLVPSTGSAFDRPVVETALRAANPSSSHIEFLHVRMDVKRAMVMMAGSGMTFGTGLVGLEQDAADCERRARDGFKAFCAEYGLNATGAPAASISASWHMVIGEEPVCLAKRARTADVVVIGRRRNDEPIAWGMMGAALMDTGRPILIAPAEPPFTLQKTVAIAWKDRPEAARAVTAAMPFIAKAERVVILSVSEDEEGEDQSCQRLRAALQWHTAHVELQQLARGERSPARMLMEAATGPGVDATLLVMGGYGHARLREAVFGGFTRHVLGEALIPVLMAH